MKSFAEYSIKKYFNNYYVIHRCQIKISKLKCPIKSLIRCLIKCPILNIMLNVLLNVHLNAQYDRVLPKRALS